MKSLTLTKAYATWVLDEDGNEWIVRDEDDNEVGRFPHTFSARDCMTAIRLGRKYELIAFNRGIEFGKDTTRKAYDSAIIRLNGQIKSLETMNIALSEKLEKFIIGDSEE